ncbi:hypothetical protein ACQV2B_20700 [Pantoea allii]|uniref:hypothetical protein n=1 Tax=Pantoea allii TaxID=574096 RepID=UPI003D31CEA9
MTFTELDHLINESGRRSLASRLLYSLLDALDAGIEDVSLDDFEKETGFARTNIRTVASFLSEARVIVILFSEALDSSGKLNLYSEAKRGRWVKHHYRLADSVRELFRR